jgi:hypothetical protein
MQRPGIIGAGNLLDPEVRAELREKVHAAMPQKHGDGAAHPAPAAPAAPAAEQQGESSPVQHRAGPYPHGDVDLSGFAANVPPGTVRPKRGRTRSYYFLTQAADTTQENSAPPAIQAPPGPKPG